MKAGYPILFTFLFYLMYIESGTVEKSATIMELALVLPTMYCPGHHISQKDSKIDNLYRKFDADEDIDEGIFW